MLRTPQLIAIVGALALCGCGKTATNLLNTGSLTSQPKAQAAPAAATPADRAMHVAATSARAQKCGYYFDPAKLRADYLAFESSNGLPAEQLPGVTKLYDFTNAKISTTIAKNDAYCDEVQTGKIKTRLAKYLAGDYSAPPRKRKAPAPSIWDFSPPVQKEKINPRWYEKNQPATVPAGEE